MKLPDGWNLERLEELAKFSSGGTPNKNRADFWGGEFPWVTAKDLKSLIIKESLDHLTNEGFKNAKITPENSILILVRGMTLHKDVPVCLTSQSVAFNQDIKALVCSKTILPIYLVLYLRFQKSMLLDLVDSAGHGTGRIDTDLLKNFQIKFPPLQSQKAIADLLATWDEAIEKTERLIQAKEKKFKHLLNTLICLPTDNGKWKETRLKNLFEERRETNREDLPLLSITNNEGVIYREDTNRKDTSNDDKSKYLRICPGDIGYNTMRMWQGVSALSSLEGVVSPAYTICIPGEKVDPKFIAFLFKVPFMIHRFYRYSQGLTSDTWNLKFHHFGEVKMPLPPLAEQQKIAELLEASQKEMSFLKLLAEKYKSQKRGLMQKLLTGQWRINKYN